MKTVSRLMGLVGLGVAAAVASSACSGTQSGIPGFAGGDDASNASSGGGESSSGGADGGSSSSAGSSSSSSSTSSSSGAGGSSGSSSGGGSSGSGVHDAGGSASSSSGGSSSSSSSSSGASSSSSGGGAPSDAAPDGCTGTPADALYFQQYNVQLINMYRATKSLPPLTLDSQLSAFALAGSTELTMDHLPHQHFINAGNTIWTMGFTSMAGENQGDPNGWRVLSSCATTNEEMQIAQIMQAMFDEGPAGDAGDHGHYENIMSTSFTRVGVGLIEVSGMLYLTNDFSN